MSGSSAVDKRTIHLGVLMYQKYPLPQTHTYNFLVSLHSGPQILIFELSPLVIAIYVCGT